MGVVDRIVEHADRLTPTERRIAEVLAGDPQAVAFGTVAQVAGRASTSGPSVVRLAVKLGYRGFVGLQAAVQAELASQLGPAHDRIRQRPPSDLPGLVHQAELDNVARTLEGVPAALLDRAVALLTDRRRQVWVIAGEVTGPVGASLAGQLGRLREGVAVLAGSDAAVGRALAGAAGGDVLVAIDIRRYERSLVAAVRMAHRRGLAVVALTDSPLSPLAGRGALALFVSASGVGPFDSMTGALALANLLSAAAAARLRSSAAARLDAVEQAWGDLGALVAEPGGAEPLATAALGDPLSPVGADVTGAVVPEGDGGAGAQPDRGRVAGVPG